MAMILNFRKIKNNISLIALYAVFLLFIVTTNPNELQVGWLLVPLVILYVALYKTFRLVFGRRQKSNQPRNRAMALLAASIPVMLMGLGSIGQLTGRDLLIITAFGIVGLFYVSRLD